MEDSVTIRGDSHGMRGALPPGQNNQAQVDDEDDGVHDQPMPQHYQRKNASTSTIPEAM